MDPTAETKVFHTIPRTLTALLLVAVLVLGPLGFLPLASAQSPSVTITSNFLLRNDITFSSDGFIIDGENIILNCNGHRIRGSGSGIGITLNGTSGVRVVNCNITNFAVGIALLSSNNNLVLDNSISGNSFSGIILEYSSDGNLLQGNTVEGNGSPFSGYGLRISGSSHNTLNENTFSGSQIGIELRGFGPATRLTQNNTIEDNVIIDNGDHGIRLIGPRTIHNLVKDNDISGNGKRAIFFLAGATLNVAKGNTLNGNGKNGILIISPENSILKNIITGNGRHGILISSSFNIISENTIIGNAGRGILSLESSSDNEFRENTISGNTKDGILVSGDRNDFIENIIEKNGRHGIFLTSTSEGNSITRNVMTGNGGLDFRDFGDNTYEANLCTSSNIPGVC